jgi:hypothetical protein
MTKSKLTHISKNVEHKSLTQSTASGDNLSEHRKKCAWRTAAYELEQETREMQKLLGNVRTLGYSGEKGYDAGYGPGKKAEILERALEFFGESKHIIWDMECFCELYEVLEAYGKDGRSDTYKYNKLVDLPDCIYTKLEAKGITAVGQSLDLPGPLETVEGTSKDRINPSDNHGEDLSEYLDLALKSSSCEIGFKGFPARLARAKMVGGMPPKNNYFTLTDVDRRIQEYSQRFLAQKTSLTSFSGYNCLTPDQQFCFNFQYGSLQTECNDYFIKLMNDPKGQERDTVVKCFGTKLDALEALDNKVKKTIDEIKRGVNKEYNSYQKEQERQEQERQEQERRAEHYNDPRYAAHYNDPRYAAHYNDPRYAAHYNDPRYAEHYNDPRYAEHYNDPRHRGPRTK